MGNGVNIGNPPAQVGSVGNQFRFQLKNGDDGLPCSTVCVVNAPAGTETELVVAYSDASNNPIPEAYVEFETTVDAAVATLSSKTGYTDTFGEARITFQSVSTASGSLMVTARVPSDPKVGELVFHIFFDGLSVPPLQITTAYGGANPVSTVDVHLYEVSAEQPGCEDVHPTNPNKTAIPVSVIENAPIQDDVLVDMLPGLGAVGTQVWTVVVTGPSGGSPLAFGCMDSVVAENGKTAKLTVSMDDMLMVFGNDDPTREATYRVTTRVDLLTGLEGSSSTIAETVVGLFTEPGEVVLPAACSLASGFLTQVCGFLVDSNGNLKSAGVAVAQLINGSLLDIIEGALGPSVTFTGQSLAKLLQKVWFGSTLSVSAEPQEQNPPEGFRVFTQTTLSETWDTVSYQWTFGQNCPPESDTCGIKSFKLSDVYGVNFMVMPDARVYDPDHISIEQHEIPGMSYGILLNHMVKNEVIPMILGGPNQVPQGMSPYEVLIAQMFGGADCSVDPAFSDCCSQFAVSAGASVPLPQTILDVACQAAIQLASQWIEGTLTTGGGSMNIGTPEGEYCRVYDENGDLLVDSLGVKKEPCNWDVSFDVMGEPFVPEAVFYGTRN